MKLTGKGGNPDGVEIYYDREKIKQYILRNGITGQLGILQEEMAELIKDISKYRRGECEYKDLAEEMADVLRVWLQVYSIVPEAVDESFAEKSVFD